MDEETGRKIIRLSGDQRDNIKNFLLTEKITEPNNIIVHGY